MTDPITESKVAEAANAAAVSREASINAQEAMIEDIFDRSFKRAFTLDDGVQRRFVDVSRANLICQTIAAIEKRLQNIEANLNKGVWIVIGAVILGVIGMVFK